MFNFCALNKYCHFLLRYQIFGNFADCKFLNFALFIFQLADSIDGTNSGMDYHIEIINKDDKLRVLQFLRRYFFRDEPLNQSIQLIPEGEDSTCPELEDYCSQASFDNNLSLMAVSTSGAIIGVLLNGKILNGDFLIFL